jgi:hypothetical protein
MRRGRETHVLGRLVLEPSVHTPERVSALWDRLGRLGAGELAKAIEELCSRLVDPEQVIHVDRLVIDAGHVREDRLEADLIEATRRALTEALLPLIGGDARSLDPGPLPPARGRPQPLADGAATIADSRTPGRRLAESVRFLLVHGSLPWWHSATEPDGLDELLCAALGQSPDETRRALVLAGQDARARRRLALQLPTSTLHEIVRLVEAGAAAFVIDCVAALERMQAEEPFAPGPPPDFRVTTWELVLAGLFVERESQFDRKRFVSRTIGAMARHFGQGHGELLSGLRRTLDGATAQQGARPVEPAVRRDERLALLSALLGRGLPPAESVPAFDEAFHALQHEPERLRWVLLAHWHRERVRQRLAERPDELLTELVHVVIPARAAEVVSYGRALQRAHATRPVIAGDAASFRRARWRFFLDVLVLQHGSAFNTRVFIRATLERLAAHYNTTYDALVPWLWRELGDLPRSPTGAHPVVVHLGALYRELRAAQRGRARRDARHGSPMEGPDSRPPAPALPSLFDRIPPDQRAITWAVVRFVETLPELATGAFGRGLSPGAIAHRVRHMALGLLRTQRDRPLRPAELLDGLIGQVAQDSGVPRDRVLRWALERKAQRGSVRDEVRGLVEQVARASGFALVPARSNSAGRDPAGEDPVRALTGFLLRGTADARPSPDGSPVLAWIDRIERESPGQVRRRIASLLRDPPARRRVLAAAGNAALTRLWAWRRPEQREAVKEAVEAIEDLGRVLASSRHERALREAFWRFLWTRRASRARRGAQLLALFVERLARREPRLLALLRSRDAGDRMVASALAGGARTAALEPRVDHRAAAREALIAEVIARWKEIESHSAQGKRVTALLRDRRARRQVLTSAGDEAMVHLWSWQRPAERDATREAIEALGGVLSSSRYRGAASVSLHEAFWHFMWSERGSEARRSDELLARFLERLAREQPRLVALLRAGAAGDALVERVLARSPGRESPGPRRREQRELPDGGRGAPRRGPAFVDVGDEAMLKRWSAAHPETRGAVAEAIAALGRVLLSSGYRDVERASLRAAFWNFVWTSGATQPEQGAQLLARFFEQLARDAPELLSVLRGSVAGVWLVEGVPGRRSSPAIHEGGASRSTEASVRVWLVRTAGVVLVWSLLQRYFERLGLVEKTAFRDLAAQERACGLIHFLASGQTELREPDLVLGKVLCGLDLEAPVPVRVEVDEATRALSESLLAFLLTSWKGIGGTTIQGLRGSFLCRDGRLSRGEDEDSWVLDVERKTHDILLGSFPWQTSTVKLPWMPQPLFVHWR